MELDEPPVEGYLWLLHACTASFDCFKTSNFRFGNSTCLSGASFHKRGKRVTFRSLDAMRLQAMTFHTRPGPPGEKAITSKQHPSPPQKTQHKAQLPFLARIHLTLAPRFLDKEQTLQTLLCRL